MHSMIISFYKESLQNCMFKDTRSHFGSLLCTNERRQCDLRKGSAETANGCNVLLAREVGKYMYWLSSSYLKGPKH